MKRALFMLMVVLSVGCYVSSAQHLATPKNPKPFRAIVWANNQLRNGFLKSINDTSLQLSQKRIPFAANNTLNVPGTTYHYADIEQMKVWKYGKVSRGIGLGAFIGIGIGAIIGLASYKKPEPNPYLNLDFGPGFSALAGAFVGVLPGAIIGGLAGTKKLRFNINRNKSHFNDMRTVVFEKAL